MPKTVFSSNKRLCTKQRTFNSSKKINVYTPHELRPGHPLIMVQLLWYNYYDGTTIMMVQLLIMVQLLWYNSFIVKHVWFRMV